MKILKLFIAIIVFLALLSLFLPQEYTVTRSLVMTAPPDTIQKHIADFEGWAKWSAWDSVTPPAGPTPADMDSGIGSGLYFSGTGLTGWFVISDDSGIDGFEFIVFTASGEKVKSNVTFFDEGGRTKVSWKVNGSVKMPPGLAPYIALSKEFLIGSTISQSLNNLKSYVEQEDR